MDYSKEQIREDLQSIQKRAYKTPEKTSYKKLHISDEDGWNSDMRTLYFKMNENIYNLILKNDMTVTENRPIDKETGERLTKSDVKQENNYAPGIWSDSKVDAALKRADELIRFIIKRDKERKDSGFYEKNKSIKPITQIKHINHHDVKDYVQNKLNSGSCVPSSVRKYVEDFQKVFESTAKAGIKSHEKVMERCSGEGEIVKSIPERTMEDRVRGVGKTDGQKGYTYVQGLKIADASIDRPMIWLMVNMHIYLGNRNRSTRDFAWDMVVNENGKINTEMEWFKDGMLKGGRKQIVEVNEAKEMLQKIYDQGEFKPSDSIFGNFSNYKIKKALEKSCEKAGVDYKGIHEFRYATTDYYDNYKVPSELAGLNRGEQKEHLADKILDFVNIEIPGKDGNLYKPHNPMVKKQEYIMVPKKDSHGNIIKNKKGEVVMEKAKRKGKNGNIYNPKRTVMGDDGHPVMEPKYTKEKLMQNRVDWLKNVYIAEQLSHNRSDANTPYRNKKGTVKKKAGGSI